jgi:hypothetical protein
MPGEKPKPAIDALLAGVLRASPRHELVPLERLTAAERRQLAELRQEPDLYGVLRRRDDRSGRGVKAVDCNTALLLLTLREPGPLPEYLRAAHGSVALRAVIQLIADGVLEVASGGGAFVSGAAARELLGPPGDPRPGGRGRLAELARAALRHAQALPADDVALLAAKLYGYNRRPLTPRWRQRLGSAGDVRRFLGLTAGPGGAGSGSGGRGGRWDGAAAGPWFIWRRGGRGHTEPAPAGGAVYKLYASPQPEALGAAGAPLLAALAAAGPFQIKVGAEARGLLRPDKLVAYFSSFERLSAAAEILAERLDGMPVQGVPFTAEIAGDGLLSWGLDPPPAHSAWQRTESWRQRLTLRLARAILAARADQDTPPPPGGGNAPPAPTATVAAVPMEPWEFALARLRLDGIDTETWTPGALAWREA